MQKGSFYLALALTVSLVSGCASGFRYNQQSVCPTSASADNGKYSSAYTPSEYSAVGIGGGRENGFMVNSDPYQGAPVYVVNGGPDTYSGRGRTEFLARGGLGGRAHDGSGRFGTPHRSWGYGLDGSATHPGPIRRNVDARRMYNNYNMTNYMNEYNRNIVNPYPGNTPTRSPRDFLAPAPPNIGP